MTSVFTWLVGTWFANFAFAHHIINSWCATRYPELDSTQHLADLKIVTTESQNVSPSMTATPWRRVNWKMCDENSIFACFDAICTQFNVTWPHCGTVRDFLAVLTDLDCRHESDFSQRDDSDSTCGRRVSAVQNKTKLGNLWMETWQRAVRHSLSLCNAILNTCPCLLAI